MSAFWSVFIVGVFVVWAMGVSVAQIKALVLAASQVVVS
jgi:hypothetical protein